MKGLIRKILKENENDFEWAENIIDDIINTDFVIVTYTGGHYSNYLYAMYKTGIPEVVKCVDEKIYGPFGHDGENISEYPLYGNEDVHRGHDYCISESRKTILGKPKKGDICRITGQPWRDIYALQRISDNKYFIMDRDCFKPYHGPNVVKESKEDFGWAEEILNKPIWDVPQKHGHYTIFYFYPKISDKEFNDYVIPILEENDIKIESVKGQDVDHLEIHSSIRIKDNDKFVALFGDVNYFDLEKEDFIAEMSKDGEEPIDGRKYFNIP